jgi:NAD-dependent DNA ligase
MTGYDAENRRGGVMSDPREKRALISRVLAPMSAARSIDQLTGMCAGVVADGVLNDQEVAALTAWMIAHEAHAGEWPCSVLYARLALALEDGMIDEDERRDLLRIIVEVAAGTLPIVLSPEASSAVSPLPFNDPAPPIVMAGRSFVLTGEFAVGPRARVSSLIVERGGLIHDKVKNSTQYLIVGSLGSEDWRHAGFGSKILRAVELRDGGIGIAIVSEQHFTSAIAV